MSVPSEPLGAPPSVAANSLHTPQWHSRGYLPHLEKSGLVQSITFRIHDALPESKIQQWQEELKSHATNERDKKLRVLIETYLDAGHGACWLRDPRVAQLVEDALLFHDQEHYHLLAWCVMPNHVHVLIETLSSWSLGKIVHSWKGFPSVEANKMLRRFGEFWQREYFDRFIRDGGHYENVLHYIENNPVKAGLVGKAEDWPFSSARFVRRATSKPFVDFPD
jgi:REP element-mobilizing transposase RayT